jgi:ammonia channel protein AmtB
MNYTFVSSIAINTTLAAASGAITTLFVNTVVQERLTGEVTYNLQYTMNGCLSGLVAITGKSKCLESFISQCLICLQNCEYIQFSWLRCC